MRSPPPARTSRSLAAALHRSQRSSAAGGAAASGGGVMVGVIAFSSAGRGWVGFGWANGSTYRPTSGPLTTFPPWLATEVTASVSRAPDELHLSFGLQLRVVGHSCDTTNGE